MPSRNGFTLIELSIVLVIIGLIIGGILVGRDLIHAAEIRATVSQLEKYNTAVNTFRTKYNGLPGDLTPINSGAAGLFTMTGGAAGTASFQDGNGLIAGNACCESLIFWRHLSDANLVDGTFGSLGNGALSPISGNPTATVSDMTQSQPATKLSNKVFYNTSTQSGINYFQMLPIRNNNFFTGNYNYNATSGFTPVDTSAIEAKIDDGLPNAGNIRAQGYSYFIPTVASWAATSTNSKCIMGGTSATDPVDTYNMLPSSGGTDGSCGINIRFN
jgi:prepilin-type N-terminal cleavage/methylation domain-containing protein